MKGEKESPWWESQLTALSAEMRRYLQGRMPGVRDEHDDLINQALSDLSLLIQRRPGQVSAAWLSSGAPSQLDRSRFRRLAMTILRRRVADFFRHQAKAWGRSADIDKILEFRGAQGSSAERRVMLAKALRVALGVLAGWTPSDRELLGMADETVSEVRALTMRERHRIRKLRENLRAKIVRALGVSVKEILRTT